MQKGTATKLIVAMPNSLIWKTVIEEPIFANIASAKSRISFSINPTYYEFGNTHFHTTLDRMSSIFLASPLLPVME